MKKILGFLLSGLFLAVPLSWAGDATLVHGVLEEDTVWKANAGPFVVSDDLTVDTGVTLTIESGTDVRFAHTEGGKSSDGSTPDTDLIIKGTLIAEGTQDTPIKFSLTGMGEGWGAIFFAPGASPDCILRECNISRGRIICNYASPTITNCHIFQGGGIEIAYLAGPHITKNRIDQNTHGITSWFYSSKLDVTYNIITNNEFGFFIKDFSSAVVANNLIYGNNKYEVFNTCPKDITMAENWWGTTVLDFIMDKIYDKSLEKAVGKVLIEPIAKTENMALATYTPTFSPTLAPTVNINAPTLTPTPMPKLKKGQRAAVKAKPISQPTAKPVPTPVPQSESGKFKSSW